MATTMSFKRQGIANLIFLLLPLARLVAAEAEPGWDQSFSLKGALGFKDNILLSRFQNEQSAFWQSSLDAFLLRVPATGPQIAFSLAATDRRYFSAPKVRKEQDLSSFFTYNQYLSSNWEFGLELGYFYFDQVTDVSVDYLEIGSLQIKSHILTARPNVTYNFSEQYYTRAGIDAERDWMDELDDYLEGGPFFATGWRYQRRSFVEIGYGYRLRLYDTRPKTTLDFTTIPGTKLRYQQHRPELRWTHAFGAEYKWRNQMRLGYERNLDNGSGIFDYHKFRFSNRLALQFGRWTFGLEGRLLNYRYDLQTVGGPGTEKWERTELSIGPRVERELLKGIHLFAGSDHLWSLSNDLASDYQANTVFTGVDWRF
jgi:hypothetical protein